jgi:hypothetical protein
MKKPDPKKYKSALEMYNASKKKPYTAKQMKNARAKADAESEVRMQVKSEIKKLHGNGPNLSKSQKEALYNRGKIAYRSRGLEIPGQKKK